MITAKELPSIILFHDVQIQEANSVITELCFDSRKVCNPQQTLFFAIKTEKNDGHHYIASLIKKGVCNFVVSQPINTFEGAASCNFFQVSDTVAALQQLAAHHRKQFHYPVIGITGSNGKTIVKEWLGAMLSSDRAVIKSPNSYNSQIGVPYAVWQMDKTDETAIFEAGISAPGEMEKLEAVIRPTMGIFTNLGSAHARLFKDNHQKLTEKLKLFRHSDCLIFHHDDPMISEELSKPLYNHLQKISWGTADHCDYIINNKRIEKYKTIIELNHNLLEIPFTDDASIENALHAIVLMLHIGYSHKTINQKMALLNPLHMRMEIKEAINQSIIINDTYSLDSQSLRIALDFLNAQSRLPNKTVIISDFEQIGELTEKEYGEINELFHKKNITRLIAIGNNIFRHQGIFTIDKQLFFHNTEDFLRVIASTEIDREAILIKGARSFHFEKIAEYLQQKTHPTVLSVNLPAIIHNLNYYRSKIKPETKMVAMVKAHSYGLGDAELINELIYHNIDYLAVAYTDEGVHLRKRNINTPIIVLGAEAHSFEMMIHYQLEPEIFNFYYLEQLEGLLQHHPEIKQFPIHIKLDTGMHRLGFDEDDIVPLVQYIAHHPSLRIASLFSHLAAAEDENEDSFTQQQIALFSKMTEAVQSSFSYPILRHILNTAGISRFPEAQFDMVRLGIGLYGFSPVACDAPFLNNTVTLKTIITQVKTIKKGETIGYNRSYKTDSDQHIAIIPIGYADGYPRSLSNGVGKVYVNNNFAPIVGKICMDMCMIDVTGLDAKIGDEVIIYGNEVPITDIIAPINRISYEMLTSISPRVQRIYVMD